MNGSEGISLIDCLYDITYFYAYLLKIINFDCIPVFKSLRFSWMLLLILLESKAIKALYAFGFLAEVPLPEGRALALHGKIETFIINFPCFCENLLLLRR